MLHLNNFVNSPVHLMLTFSVREGGIENKCDQSGFESLTNPALVTVGYSLIEIYPAVNLVYVIHIADLKSLKQKCHCFK